MRENFFKLIVALLMASAMLFACTTAVDPAGNTDGNGGNPGGNGDSISPLTVTVAEVGEGSVKLSWNELEGVTHYRVMFSDSAAGEYKLGNLVDTTHDTVSFLLPGKNYFFKVRAVTALDKFYIAAYGVSSNVAEATTTNSATLATPLVTTSSSTAHSVTINWGEVAGADRYNIYRMDSQGRNYCYYYTYNIVNQYSSGNTITDDNLESETTYRYRIVAYNSLTNETGMQSAEIAVTTKAATLTLGAIPYHVSSYEIKWTLPTISSDEELRLYQFKDASAKEPFTSSNAHGYLDPASGEYKNLPGKDVEPGKTYYYKFRLINRRTGDVSPFSLLQTIKIPQAELTLVPQNLKALIVADYEPGEPLKFAKEIKVSWDPLPGADLYHIYYINHLDNSVFFYGSSSTNSYNFMGKGSIDRPVYYDVMVRAVNTVTKEAGPAGASVVVRVK